MATDPSPSTSFEPREGDILAGRYRVDKVVGAGGMGVVVAATHIELLGERVAIKILGRSLAHSDIAMQRFVREARATVKIRNEHVVRVADVGRFPDGVPYMVMDLLTGADLRAIMRARGKLGIEETASFIMQICDGLASAHVVGIVHRDMKPSNVFVTYGEDGLLLVKLLDFGISKVMEDQEALTVTAETIGSPPYMSPEQIQDPRNVDARSDIWSVGIMLHELLAGARPFVAPTTMALPMVILGQPPARVRDVRPDVPEALQAVILRCLEKDPSKRFPDVADLAAAVAPFAPGIPAAAVERIARVLRRRAPGAPDGSEEISSGSRSAASAPLDPGTLAGEERRPSTENVRPPRRTALFVGSIALSGLVVLGGALFLSRGKPASPGVASPQIATSAPASAPIMTAPIAVPDPEPVASSSAVAPASSPPVTPPPKPTTRPTSPGTAKKPQATIDSRL